MKLNESTSNFKTIIAFTAVFMLCALLFSIYLSYQTSTSTAESLHLLFLHEQDEKIETHLHRYYDDILFLAGVPPVQGMIRAREGGGYDRKEQSSYALWVKRLQQIFESLGTRKTEYLKLRYMDEKGNELVRVDFKDGKARIVPDTELENKVDRYYFTEAMKLSAGQSYFSNIDLNQDRGNIAVPYQPTQRIAAPIFNESGQPRGIIIASVAIQFLLHSPTLLKSQKNEEIYIIDQDGYFLHHNSDPDREWGSAYDLNTGKNLKAYQPDLFGKIMNNDNGMAFSFDSYRFVLFSRVEFPHIKEKYLVIVSEVSPTVILAPMFRTVIAALSFIFFFSVVLYFFVRRATQALREKEAALTGSEERFRRAVMDAAFPMMIQAEDGEVVQINNAWEEITGYAQADIPTISDWMTKAYGQSKAVTKAYIDTIFSLDGRKDQGEYIVTAKDGSKLIWDLASAPLGTLSDGRRLLVSMARDVTEKKQAEEQYKTMLRTSMDSFWITDAQGHFLDANDAYCSLIGYTRDELMNMSVADIEAIETPEVIAWHIQKIIESGYDRFETRHRSKDGRPIDVEISCNFVPVNGGRFFVYLRDLTERKKIEAIAQRSYEELELRVKERTTDLAEANKLLDALSTAQSMFISETDPKILFDGILQSILALTESQYGFMGEVFLDEKDAPYLKTHAISNIAWNEETRKYYETYASEGMEFHNLNSLFGPILTSGQPVISNDPAHDPRRGGLPEGHPPLDTFLGMPLYRAKKLVGAIGIANRPGGYDENLVNYFQSFFVSCANIIEAYRSDQNRKQAVEEINRNYDVQSTLSAILQTSLKNISFEEILSTILKKILAIPWFSFEEKGAIFLIEDDPDILVLKAYNNFSDQARESCGRIPVGKCHCGQAMLTKKIEFSDCVDEGHEIRYEGMVPHGDYCIPILFQEQAIGVLNVHLKEGHKRDPREEEFLSMVANTIAAIIARRQSEDALRKSESLLRTVLDTLPVGVWISDEKGVLQYGNQAGMKIWTGAEYVGIKQYGVYKGWWADTGKTIEPEEWAMARAITKGETSLNELIEIECFDGSHKMILNSGIPLRDAQQNIRGAFVVNQDVTQEKEAEKIKEKARELEIAVHVAEAANRAKSDFLASMSHELRTPMNAIIGFSQVLQAKYYGDLNEKQLEYIKDVLDSGNHLLSLINDILDLSKVEAGKMQLELSRVDITALLKSSLLMIQEKALRHGITVELNIPASLEGMEMNGDERKLKQIMFNFLSNAAKFTPEGGRIEVSARLVGAQGTNGKAGTDEGTFVEICVSDTGIGIRAEDRERVFEPFVQVKGGTTDKTPGTGLGLTLTKEYVELHGGRVWVESEGEGKGSRFVFVIPIAE
jgi:PAS domain S-box-containing protein